jgi:transposase-like protein
VRTLPRPDADRLAAEVLDDAIRTGERCEARVSARAIAERVGVDESLVRCWRDPHSPKHARLSLLLQLPGDVYRAVLAGLAARRLELYGEEIGPATAEGAAAATLVAQGELTSALGRAMTDGRIDAAEADDIRTRAQAEIARLQQLLARLPAAR